MTTKPRNQTPQWKVNRAFAVDNLSRAIQTSTTPNTTNSGGCINTVNSDLSHKVFAKALRSLGGAKSYWWYGLSKNDKADHDFWFEGEAHCSPGWGERPLKGLRAYAVTDYIILVNRNGEREWVAVPGLAVANGHKELFLDAPALNLLKALDKGVILTIQLEGDDMLITEQYGTAVYRSRFVINPTKLNTLRK